MNLIEQEKETKRISIESFLNAAYKAGMSRDLYSAYDTAIRLMDDMEQIEINTPILSMEAQAETAVGMDCKW